MVSLQLIGDYCRIYQDTTLQGLNQYLVQDDGTHCYYPVAPFEQTVDQWPGTPIIFSQLGEHPDISQIAEDRRNAIADIDGRLVGQVVAAAVIKQDTGRPALKIQMQVCDPDVNTLFHNADLGISSAFTCTTTSIGDARTMITGSVTPNHVLLFRRDPLNGIEQRDMQAIVNTGETMTETEKIKQTNAERQPPRANSILQDIYDCLRHTVDKCRSLLDQADNQEKGGDCFGVENRNREKEGDGDGDGDVRFGGVVGDVPVFEAVSSVEDLCSSTQMEEVNMSGISELLALQSTVREQQAALSNMQAEFARLQQELLAMTEQKNALTAEVERYRAIEAEAVKVKEELARQTFLNSVRPGYINTPEKADSLYNEFRADPVAFAVSRRSVFIDLSAATEREGAQHVAVQANTPSRKGTLNFNKTKKVWEVI